MLEAIGHQNLETVPSGRANKKCSIKDSEKFDVLVVDPPWNQGKTGYRGVRPNQTKKMDYPTLSKEEIIKLPIIKWSKTNCFIWLWVTNSKDKKLLHLRM